MQNKPLDQKSVYQNIYDGEIFQKSRCIWHENIMMDWFRSLLTSMGYESSGQSNKKYSRSDRTAVICLADDFYTCQVPYTGAPTPVVFDHNTTVVTDNFATCATQYKIVQLPESYFGIYSYQPSLQQWTPERRFTFSVNRIDFKRTQIFVELLSRTLFPNSRVIDLQRDLINFNCWSWQNSSDTADMCRHNFEHEFKQFSPELQIIYQTAFDTVADQMPFKNHEYTLEQSHVKSWLNVIVETYSSDTSIALSEKIFRALVTPVPWMVYAGRYTVSYLKRLGFDVIDDLVNHRYDWAVDRGTGQFGDKMVDFFRDAHITVENLKQRDFEQIKLRCQKAAAHNQNLLANMRQAWPNDLAQWMPTLVQSLQ